MKRGPKPGKAGATKKASTAAPGPRGLGEIPAELTGLGRDLWTDTVAHLAATGSDLTVYRTSLRIMCRLVESLAADAGLNRIDACRRWLHEMGVTVATANKTDGHHGTSDPTQAAENGRARLFRLLDGKQKRA